MNSTEVGMLLLNTIIRFLLILSISKNIKKKVAIREIKEPREEIVFHVVNASG
jgi:hypothetical protein